MCTAAASNLFSVTGKNVLVTGSSRGIGLMIASGFASAGANVLITSRDEKACREAVNSIQQRLDKEKVNGGGRCGALHYVSSNVGNRAGCKELAQYTKELFDGKLDVLVNNAGTSWGEDPYERESGKANWGWDKVMDLNVKGMFYLSRECVPMLERNKVNNDISSNSNNEKSDPGRIINIGSIAGMITQEAPTHAYDVSKAAVHHLTKKMAADLAPRQITVNAIAPGYVPSRMSQGLELYVGDSNKISESIPLKRMGDEDDMAGAAIYLSSKAGSWTTGVILNVDGGAVTVQMPLASL
jgi:NAD(P)-dependent dehydrogenase (short-subunit alcohol dehydrogenase family)